MTEREALNQLVLWHHDLIRQRAQLEEELHDAHQRIHELEASTITLTDLHTYWLETKTPDEIVILSRELSAVA